MCEACDVPTSNKGNGRYDLVVVGAGSACLEAGAGGVAKTAVPVSAKLAIPLPTKGKTVFKSFDGLGNLPR